jgi:hypothetical protein
MLRARWLGRVPYQDALTLQAALHGRAADDYLLLLEHPHVFTLGTTRIRTRLWSRHRRRLVGSIAEVTSLPGGQMGSSDRHAPEGTAATSSPMRAGTVGRRATRRVGRGGMTLHGCVWMRQDRSHWREGRAICTRHGRVNVVDPRRSADRAVRIRRGITRLPIAGTGRRCGNGGGRRGGRRADAAVRGADVERQDVVAWRPEDLGVLRRDDPPAGRDRWGARGAAVVPRAAQKRASN